ncbi:MAG: AAA family ATPase [Candidatus Pacearchaeota archaeon]|jgi:exonuclease SbcC
MILKRLLIENVRSYNKQEIVFPMGSTLLSGDIGSGKTTVLLAIEFALFGLQPSQKATSLLKNGKENGRVVFEFEIDGKEIILERSLKRGKKAVSQDIASITIDNERFEGSVTEIKSKVLKLLNYPSEFAKKTNLLYKFTVYTPQEEMKQIILEPGDLRLNTLRHVFGIDKYKRIEENTTLLTSKLREKIRMNEGMFYDLEGDKEELSKKQEALIFQKQNQSKISQEYASAINFKHEKEQALEEIKEKIEEKRILETEKEKTMILLSEKKQQIATLNNNIRTLVIQIEEAKKISFNDEDFKTLNERIKFHENKYDEIQKEYINIISNIKTQESRKRETDELKAKISRLQKCPTCLQEVSDDYKGIIFRKIEEEFRETQKRLEELTLKKNELIEQVSSVKKILEDFKKQKSELELLKIKSENLKEKQERIFEIETQKSSIQKDLEMLEKHIKTMESSILEFLKYDLIYEQRNKDLQEAKITENKTAIKQAETNKEVQFLEQQIKEKQEKITKKEGLKLKTEKIRELEYWISEKFLNLILFTEKQVMATLKEEFSNLFSRWFSILVSDLLTAKLDDTFSPVIEQQDYELDYAFLSGGERTAIALAYRLALNQVINSILSNIKTSNLVILDEPTDGFSASQLDKMRDVLGQLNAEQLILVSHEQKMESFVDNIIRFTKEGGVTKVEKNITQG